MDSDLRGPTRQAAAWARRRTRSLLAGLIVVLVVGGFWYRHTRSAPVYSVTPRRPELIDLRAGTFRGVRIGDSWATALRVLGQPTRQGGFPHPIGAPADATPPGGPGDAISLDYPNLAIVIVDHRVRWIDTTSPNAETTAGVGIGDSLSIARRAYPHLACYSHDEATDEAGAGPPFCAVHYAKGVNLELFGDPIVAVIIRGSGASR